MAFGKHSELFASKLHFILIMLIKTAQNNFTKKKGKEKKPTKTNKTASANCQLHTLTQSPENMLC